jgi:serine protease Do
MTKISRAIFIIGGLFGLIVSCVAISVGSLFLYQRYYSHNVCIPALSSEAAEQKMPSCELSQDMIEHVIARTTEPWAAIQNRINNTVVQVIVQVGHFHWLEPYRAPMQSEGAGSGFFIRDDGHLITNAHVVDQAKVIYIQIPSLGKERLKANLVGISFDRDLALLKLDDDSVEKVRAALGKVPVLPLGDSSTVHRADEVLAVGYPLGQQGLKSTKGVVSGRENVSNRHVIQIDASINHGSSGGPAINLRGEVIGINSYGFQGNGEQNIGYIVPVNELKIILDSLYGTPNKIVRTPFLGIVFNPGSTAMVTALGNPQPGGPYITEVIPGSLMEKAGIKSGDMIYSIDGHQVDLYGEFLIPGQQDKISLSDYISVIKAGQKIVFVVYRNGKKISATFNLNITEQMAVRVMFPDFEKMEYTIVGGLVVQPLNMNLIPLLLSDSPELVLYQESKRQAEPALIITHIMIDSVALRSRALGRGQRIKEVNGVVVKTLDEFNQALKRSAEDGFIRIKTTDGTYAVLSLREALSDEARLARMYLYTPSSIVQELMAYVRSNESNQKKAS